MKHRSIGLLAAGHLFTDINQGAIPALLPLFISEHGLSYAAAAGIVFAASITSSIMQPLLGYYADCTERNWLMPVGVLVAGLGVALAGILPSYPLILASVALSGLGVAAFHPYAASLANSMSENKKAMGMSYFAVGGNAGFALGPILATAVLFFWGLKGTLALITLPAIMAVILFREFKGKTCQATVNKHTRNTAGYLQDQWFPFLRLTGAVTFRSVMFYGLNTFLPLYWINVLHQSKEVGSSALSLLFASGVAGTLIGGKLADKYGFRFVVISGFSLLIPVLYIFNFVTNPYLAAALLIPMGLSLFAPFSPMIVLGQKYLPNRVGLASGITLGLAVSIGGLAAPALGWAADIYGLKWALFVLAFLPVLATLLSLSLPSDKISKDCPSCN